jgi:amino acid adenylation domain-containing protein
VTGAEARWDAVRSLLRAGRDDPPLEPVARDRDLPASFGQERLWFLDRLQPGSTAYNLAVACRLQGSLDVSALERSLTELIDRHEILRTTLAMVAGRIVQRISPAVAATLQPQDIGSAALDAWATEKAGEPFDLEGGPLLRVSLARLAPHDHCLLLVQHHVICDAWSFEVFMRDLGLLYDAHSAGRESPLVRPALQYADFACWQRQRLSRDSRASLLEYWKGQLRGELPLLGLPVDRQRRPRSNRQGASHAMTLTSGLTGALKSLGSDEGATLYMVLLAAFLTLLHRYTGDEDVIVGSPIANRNRSELDGILGLFTNTLALRVDLGGQPTFRQLLARVRETTTGAFAHQDLPFELLVGELQLPRHRERSPLFDVMFAFQNIPRSQWRWSGLNVDGWNVNSSAAKLDLALTMQETAEGLSALLEYDAELFEAPTISRMLGHLATLLDGVARDPDQRLTDLPLVSAPERQLLIAKWNDTASRFPRDLAVHRVFEAEARRSPEAIALVSEHETLSYDDLNRRANQLARHLVGMRLGAEALVGICLERSPSLIVAQLAILKAGCVYVPLDATTPMERTAEMLKKVAVVVTDEPRRASLAGLATQVLVGDPRLQLERQDDLEEHVAAERLAYVMFTSGTTGRSRGVCVTHRGIVRLVRGATYASLTPDEVFLQLAPVSFDASTFEIWGALLNGGKLALAPSRPLAIGEIGALIRRHGVTTLWLTSGLFELFVDSALDQLAPVRQMLTGGDVVSAPHAERFLRRMKSCRLINCYGPTENTTFTCTHAIERVEPGRSIPIGRPIADTKVYVLDGRLEPVPLGVAGEAYVGGDGLARGYLDDEVATRERFLVNPFVSGDRLYRTGDRVRRRADGNLEFLGRTDDQIKLRGFRVEPAEVERAVRQYPGISGAAVLADDRVPGDKRLVAYVVAPEHDDELPARLRGFLRASLPDHMVPSTFVVVERLPLTDNGKLDRRALPTTERNPTSAAVPPRDELERKLVALFAKALDVPAVGIHDSFFDAGGDSLSAMRLAVEIERETGTEFPLAMLFDKSTVAQLATELRQRSAAGASHGSSLVSIKEGSSASPLFLMAGGHGGRSELNIYAKLMGRLAADETVYGLTAPAQSRTVEEIAAGCIANLRRRQPRGPYRIGGECVGGVVAYEIAQQLSASGEAIALLLLIDSWCPTAVGVLHHHLLGQPLTLLKLGLSFLAELPRRNPAAEPWLAELRRRAIVSPEARRYMRACMRYRPRGYPGRLTLLASDANLRRGIVRAWQRLAAGGVTIRRAPGNHETYARKHAEQTAEQLRICLEERAD